MKIQACQLMCGSEPATRPVAGYLVGEACYARLQDIAATAGERVASVRTPTRPAFAAGARKLGPAPRGKIVATRTLDARPCKGCGAPFTPVRKPGGGRTAEYGACCPAAKRHTHQARGQRRSA